MSDAFTSLQQIEDGLQLVAMGVEGYTGAAMAEVLAALRRDGRPNLPALGAFEGQVGVVRLAETIVCRMRALGLGVVLERARTVGTVPADWVDEFGRAWARYAGEEETP